MKKRGKTVSITAIIILGLGLLFSKSGISLLGLNSFGDSSETENTDYIGSPAVSESDTSPKSYISASDASASDYTGVSYAYINGNIPEFTEADLTGNTIFESYGDLDSLGRCTYAYAEIDKTCLPTKKRGDISGVHPTGWHSVKYDIIPTGSLYNRSHLIAYSLTGQNANEKNLITGTAYFNTKGMAEFEEKVLDAVKYYNMRVLYRVRPIFKGDNLICDGVQMEAYSLSDNGSRVKFNIFVYNVQPGIAINYKTGDSFPL